MVRRPRPRALRAAGASVLTGGILASVLAPASSMAAPLSDGPGVDRPTGVTCDAGYVATLDATTKGEKDVTLPYRLRYDAGNANSPDNQGSNPSGVGYDVEVVSAQRSVKFGTFPTDRAQGVPWAEDGATHGAGGLPAWGLDKSGGSASYTVRITYDKPVYGMRTAITDLDVGGEAVRMDAFASPSGGSAIPLRTTLLDAPATIPALASSETHDGNTAYVFNQARVTKTGENTYASKSGGGVSDNSGSVFFAFDSDEPVQRLEMTYSSPSGTGFWFVPPSVPQACVQPQVSISSGHEGDTTTLTSAIQNSAGNARVEDIGYTYRLPEGVVVADDPKIRSGCGATITAEPGSREIVISGASVVSGASSCDWSVDVTFATGGTKTFDESNITAASNVRVDGTKPVSVEITTDQAGVDIAMTAAPADGGELRVGSQIVYSATVRNTGNAPLTTVAVTDGLGTALHSDDLPIAPGASATFVSAEPYTVTQADVDRGSVGNDASVTASTPFGSTADDETGAVVTDIVRAPALDAELRGELHASGDDVQVGDTISYVAEATNSGNTTLTAVGVEGAEECARQLAPGRKADCALTEHTITQADIDAGKVVRDASIVAGAPDGSTVTTPVTVTTPIAAAARAVVSADAELQDGGDGRADAGDSVVTHVVVRNSGNVTLSAAELAVDAGTPLDCASDVAPGQSVECETTRVLTQADIDAGTVTVAITGGASTPAGDRIEFDRRTVDVEVPAAAAASVQVRVETSTAVGSPRAGDVVRVSASIVNTGNVTLSDSHLATVAGDPIACPSDIAPGQTVDCTVLEHTLTQDEVDAGTYGVAVDGSAATPTSGRLSFERQKASVELPADATATTLVEAVIDAGTPHAGDVVRVRGAITNTGNVTLRDPHVRTDAGTSFDCPSTIAPGQTVECETLEHELTQADVDAGTWRVVLTGTAATPAGAELELPEAESTVQLDHAAAGLTLHAAYDTGDDDRLTAGDVVRVSPVVRNDGNVTLRDIHLVDASGDAIDCGEETLAPGKERDCSAREVVLSQDDLDRGVVTIAASGSATTPSGESLPIAEARIAVDLPADPALRVTATATVRSGERVLAPGEDGVVTASVGDVVEWDLAVENTGTVRASDLRALSTPTEEFSCGTESLDPGARGACTATHVVTAADLASGSVKRTVHVEGLAGAAPIESGVEQRTVASEEVDVAVRLRAPAPELAFTGAELGGAASAAIALLGLGGALVALRRFRRRGGLTE